MKNLEFYDALRSVPKEAQKTFNNGRFSGTDINPMWRIKKMTEIFGAVGFGWYYEVVRREIITSPDGTMCAFIAVNLYVKICEEWSKPIYGEGGNTFATKTKQGYTQTSDEAYKMALTDAVSNATKQLGLGADIWFSQDKTKYTNNYAGNPTKIEDDLDIFNAIDEIERAKSVEELGEIYRNYVKFQKNEKFLGELKAKKESINKK